MDGRTFWDIFLGARIPDKELIALGEDIGYMRGAPSSLGQNALLKLGFAMKSRGAVVSTNILFTALKREMPGVFSRKGLLTGLASEYDDRKPFGALRGDVRQYITDVGSHLPAATKAAKSDISIKTSAPHASPSSPKRVQKPVEFTLAPDKPPTGLTMNEYNYLQATIRKLSDAATASQVTASQLAAARNLAARGKMQATLASLDREIAARGEGAQTEEATAASGTPSRAGFGKAGIIVVLALFFAFLKR